MRRAWCWFLLGVALWFIPQARAELQGKLVEESWDAGYLNGAKAGFVHTTVRETDVDGEKILKTSMELDLSVRRFNDQARLRMITSTDETPTGRVQGVMMRMFLGKEQQLVVTGTVVGNRLHVTASGPPKAYEKDIPWNDKVIGLYRQERMYRQRQVKPGDRFRYLSYEPTVTAVVTTHVVVKDFEDVDFPNADRRQLLRVEVTTDKIQGVQLPPLTLWLDKALAPVRSEVDLPGVGKLTLLRTTRDLAKQKGAADKQTDLGSDQLVPVKRAIPQPYEVTSAVYRITLKGEDDPGTAFARDGRQRIDNINGNTFDLHVQARRVPETDVTPSQAPDEYLKSCYFVNSEDAKVQELARLATGRETDAWAKARRIERWVYENIRNKNFSENFATSDHVARKLEGDCTEHALLAAAMCRAVGVPSRTAVGLIYVSSARGPSFGFHMWTEVWVRGQWMPIDATLGRGFVGATHLKVLDSSWHDVQSFTPLLPLLRVVGKASIEVVSINGKD